MPSSTQEHFANLLQGDTC